MPQTQRREKEKKSFQMQGVENSTLKNPAQYTPIAAISVNLEEYAMVKVSSLSQDTTTIALTSYKALK